MNVTCHTKIIHYSLFTIHLLYRTVREAGPYKNLLLHDQERTKCYGKNEKIR